MPEQQRDATMLEFGILPTANMKTSELKAYLEQCNWNNELAVLDFNTRVSGGELTIEELKDFEL